MKLRDEVGRDGIDPVVIIAELRDRGLAFIAVVDGQAASRRE